MITKKSALNFLKQYGVIVFGCVVYSLGVAVFLDADNLAAGGVTGIAIFINYLSGFNTGWLIAILNVPMFILGAVFFGKKFIISTLLSTLLSSALIELWTFLFSAYLPLTENILISAVVGGALYGAGLGLIFRMGSTTGGTDIIVKILRKKFRHLKTGIISMVVDVVICGIALAIYQDFELFFYTILTLVVFTVCFDFALYGGNTAKLVLIVTEPDKSEQICNCILNELDISATLLSGTGAYSGKDKNVVMCVVKNTTYPKLRDVIKRVDGNAFTVVCSAKEIYGEGYKPHADDEL